MWRQPYGVRVTGVPALEAAPHGVARCAHRRGGGIPLHLDVQRIGDRVVIAVTGELAVATAPELRQRLLQLHTDGEHHLVVDLDGTDVIDEMGLGVLLGGAWRARSRDGSFALVCTSERIREVLELTGMDRAVDVHASVADAVVG